MFKRGICTIDGLVAGERLLARKRFRPNCYIGLYEEVTALSNPNDIRWQELILNPFAVNNAVFKRTTRERFNEFDTNTIDVLRELPELRESCVVHDMAVSDARTASDFFDKLSSEFGDRLEFYATDICLSVCSLRQPGRRLTVVIDPHGRILQIVFPPFVLPVATNERWTVYPVNRLLRAVLTRTSVRHVMHLLRTGCGALERRKIVLLCRDAREHLERHTNFHVETYDALEAAPRKYTIVRAMNIFNRSYFSEDALAKAISNVCESLNEGGVFITGSNEDAGSMVDGTIYRKIRGGFDPIYRSALGSQVNDIILRTRANPA